MRTKLCFLTLTLLAVFAGCVPSWNPLYTEKDLVFDPQLLGTWKGKDGEIWKFEKEDDKQYKLSFTGENGRKAIFEARLLKIKDRRFLDVYPHDDEEEELKLNVMAFMTLLPTHLFFRVDEIGTSVEMAAVDFDWVKKHLEQDPKRIAHLKREDRIVFTAETKDLQTFVLKHAEGEALFDDPFTLKRESSK